jgi:hypothetical protein
MCRQHTKQHAPSEATAYEGQTHRLSAEQSERVQGGHGNAHWLWTPLFIWLGIALVKPFVAMIAQSSTLLLQPRLIVLAVICIGVGLWLIARDAVDSVKELNDVED